MREWLASYCSLLFLVSIFCSAKSDFGSSEEVKPYRPPVLASSGLIEFIDEKGESKGLIIINRQNPPFGKALPGGKIEYGETVENGFLREMKEELNLDKKDFYDLRQFHVYSDSARDPRFHVVDVTFIGKTHKTPKAGDDASKAFICSWEEIENNEKPLELVFDHRKILDDYLRYRQEGTGINPDITKSLSEEKIPEAINAPKKDQLSVNEDKKRKCRRSISKSNRIATRSP